MVIVSTRRELFEMARAAARRLDSGPVELCSNPDLIDNFRPLDGSARVAVLALDCGCSIVRPHLPALARQWHTDYPYTTFVHVVPLLDAGVEIDALTDLMRAVSGNLLRAPHVEDPAAWERVLRRSAHSSNFEYLKGLLVNCTLPASIVEETAVMHLLEQAPAIRKVEEYCNHFGIERRSQWRILNRGQRTTADLLKAFRVWWAVRLRELGWPSSACAEYLGYKDTQEWKRMAAPFDLGVRQLEQLSSVIVGTVYAQLLVRTLSAGQENFSREAMPTLRDIGLSLMANIPTL